MIIKLNRKVGAATAQIEIEEKDNKDALALMCFFSEPDYCFLCKGTNLKWESNKAQTDQGTFTYIKRRCLNPACKATSTMGEYKTGGFFWKPFECIKNKRKSDSVDCPVMRGSHVLLIHYPCQVDKHGRIILNK